MVRALQVARTGLRGSGRTVQRQRRSGDRQDGRDGQRSRRPGECAEATKACGLPSSAVPRILATSSLPLVDMQLFVGSQEVTGFPLIKLFPAGEVKQSIAAPPRLHRPDQSVSSGSSYGSSRCSCAGRRGTNLRGRPDRGGPSRVCRPAPRRGEGQKAGCSGCGRRRGD